MQFELIAALCGHWAPVRHRLRADGKRRRLPSGESA